MRIQKSRFLNSPASFTAAFIILLSLNFMAPHACASSPWVEVNPPDIGKLFSEVRLVHFVDSDIGFAAVYGHLIHGPEGGFSIVLRTTDGGQTWRQAAPVDDAFGFGIHFISPMIGWRTRKYREKTGRGPALLADVQFFQTTDGGLTWNLRHGKVTELIDISDLVFPPRLPLGLLGRLLTTHIYFVDERHGWLLGYCHGWNERYLDVRFPDNDPGDAAGMLTANYIYSTRDGGQTWKCHVDIYKTVGDGGRSPLIDAGIRRPRDIDFVDTRVGWVAAPLASYTRRKPHGKWMYRTVDEGNTWSWLDQPSQFDPDESIEIDAIEFLDSRRGWAVGDGVWFTDDGGETWTKKFSGLFTAIHFANSREGWFAGIELPSEGRPRETPPNKIYHTVDGGLSWEIEWVAPESYQAISHFSYHAVTKSLWAGGRNGLVLQRPMTVSPIGKLTTLWGKLKAGPNTAR